MKILVYGGTRFIGKEFVSRLLTAGHRVTVVSRRAAMQHSNLTVLHCEREEAVEYLVRQDFDQVVDFMAYDIDAVRSATGLMQDAPYLFLSTAWIDMFENGGRSFLPHEASYVSRKREAESFLEDLFRAGKKVSICRLPVTLGEEDHTERFKFYAQRVYSNKLLILPDGGEQISKFAFKGDVSCALAAFIEFENKCDSLIFDAHPIQSISLAQMTKIMARALGSDLRQVAISKKRLADQFPDYLKFDPLWREGSYSQKRPNLFTYTGSAVTSYEEWVSKLAKKPEMIKVKSKNIWLTQKFLKREQAFAIANS